jgi:hypothetical protein
MGTAPVRRPLAVLAVLAAALLAGAPPALRAGTAAVSEKAFEDTSIGYSLLPLRGWEPKPKKNPDDPLARTDAGGWYCKDKAWEEADCTVLKFGSYFPEEERAVATPKAEGEGGGGKPPADGEGPQGPRTAKDLFGKGPESFDAWHDLWEKRLRQGGYSLDLRPTPAKFGDEEGRTWEGEIRRQGATLLLMGASVKKGGLEVAVLYRARDHKDFTRDLKGAFKASLKSLRILPERTMRKAREALEKKVAGGDPEAAWATRAIAALPPGWLHRKTKNYVILYDKTIDTTNPGLIERIGNQLEWIRAQVYEPMFPAARPFTATSIVKVTQDAQQYDAYGAPDGSAGYWSWPSRELVFFCKPGSRAGVELTLDVLNHEAFHQYIFYAVGQVSPHSWFNEGHGDYFAGFDLKDGKFKPGKFHWRQERIRDALEGNHHVPLAKFLKFSQQEYYRRGSNKREGEDARQNYAQGWSLIWFLRTTKDPRYTGILARYFDALKEAVTEWKTKDEEAAAAAGRAPSEIFPPQENESACKRALDAAFEGVDIDQLERDWIASKPY